MTPWTLSLQRGSEPSHYGLFGAEVGDEWRGSFLRRGVGLTSGALWRKRERAGGCRRTRKDERGDNLADKADGLF